MRIESSGKPDAWKLARPVWGWGRGETPRPTPLIKPVSYGDVHSKVRAQFAALDEDDDSELVTDANRVASRSKMSEVQRARLLAALQRLGNRSGI